MVDDFRTTIRVPKELHQQVREKAKCEDLTFSQVVRKLLREWVADEPPQDEKAKSQEQK